MTGGSGVARPLERVARAWLSLLSRLVPSGRRSEWLEEWEAELWQLRRRGAGALRRRGGEARAVVGYLAGAPRSAFWEMREEWMTDLWQDVRYGLRGLFRAPGFLVVAVVTLALGIGANTTVFTLVDALLFREPALVAQPDRLVRLGRGHEPGRFDNWSYPVYRDFRARADWFSGVAGFSGGGAILGAGVEAEAVPVHLVSDNYFAVLGVRPALGRGFLPEDAAAPGAPAVAVISHDLWRRRFAGRADVIGETIPVNGRAFEVVGVAPAGFRGADLFTRAPDLWLPATMLATLWGPGSEARLERRGSSWFWVFARLAPGVSFDRAAGATAALYARFDEENPELAGQGIWIVPGVGATPDERDTAGGISRILAAIVLLVLLVACANLAGLALARGAGRRQELGIRAALGASRPRVVRQLLTEALLVALFGAAGALALTAVLAGRIPAILPYDVAIRFAADARVLAFGLALALAAGLLFGLLPALSAARTDLRATLGAGARTVAGGSRLRRGLVAAQLALSFVLLAGTGVLLRSLDRVQRIDPGFDADRVAVIGLDADMRTGYDAALGRAFYDRLREEVAAMPGVEAAGLVAELPVADFQSNHTPMTEADLAREGPRDGPPPLPVLSNYADAGFFTAMGMPLEAGRLFRPADHGENAARVVVVNRALARRFFGDESPIGRSLPFGADPVWEEPTTVIGVVGDHRNRSLRGDPAAGYWIPFDRNYRGDMDLVVRTPGDPAVLAPRVAALVERIDPGMPVLRAAPLRDLVGGTLRDTRLISTLIAIMGAIALALAAVGLYAVMAYAVASRTREMGVRMAVGASAGRVLRLVLGQGLLLAGLGLLLGIPMALAGLRLLRGLLFGVSPADPVALAAGGAALLLVAALASLVPAWRATRVEPVTALREE
ncbi:MAG TPA: ADOP family duplicated permease [Longimicrobiales bacterium]|nr:ADOP family duplicated permease [Longimicrobiales bacterium]